MQETISKIIKQENWNILSPTEQAMLKKMGFLPGIPAKPKAPRLPRQQQAYPTLKPYYIVAHIKCSLCGHLSEEAYHMKAVNYESRSNGEPHLKAHLCPIQEAKNNEAKRELHSRPYCVVCKERLKELSKEELINKLLIKARQCACTWR